MLTANLHMGDLRVWKDSDGKSWEEFWNGVEWDRKHVVPFMGNHLQHFNQLVQEERCTYYRPKHWPHTAECDARSLVRNQMILAWKQQYPYYCRNCKGWGQFYMAGDFYDPGSVDPCPECTSNEEHRPLCARCTKPGLQEDGSGPCIYCKWNYDDGLPPQEDCHCYM